MRERLSLDRFSSLVVVLLLLALLSFDSPMLLLLLLLFPNLLQISTTHTSVSNSSGMIYGHHSSFSSSIASHLAPLYLLPFMLHFAFKTPSGVRSTHFLEFSWKCHLGMLYSLDLSCEVGSLIFLLSKLCLILVISFYK